MCFPALDNLRDHLENPEKLSEMKYLLLEQKYLELLSQKNRMEALKVLRFDKLDTVRCYNSSKLSGPPNGVDSTAPQADADPRAF